jgi:hypothetical protein
MPFHTQIQVLREKIADAKKESHQVPEALVNHYSGYHQEIAFHFQVKKRAQLIRKPLQEFSATNHFAPHTGRRRMRVGFW